MRVKSVLGGRGKEEKGERRGRGGKEEGGEGEAWRAAVTTMSSGGVAGQRGEKRGGNGG